MGGLVVLLFWWEQLRRPPANAHTVRSCMAWFPPRNQAHVWPIPLSPFQGERGMGHTAALLNGNAKPSVVVEAELVRVLVVRTTMCLAAPHGSDRRQDCF